MRRGSGLVLGYESGDDTVFGFARPDHTPTKGEAITYDGDGPVCVIAPTGAGKGRDFLIPNILTWPGPLIVTDLKGELASVCARRRRELGFKVAVLDPFEITRFKTARLNPLDIFALKGAMLECDAEMLASQLSEGHIYEKDAFWNDQASSLIAGLIVAIATLEEPKHRNLTKLQERLFSDDVVYNLAVLLDTQGKKLPTFSYGAIAAFLQAASENTRPSILSTAHTYMRALNSEAVGRCLTNSSIKLADVIEGKPLDVFLCIPPEKLKSHKCLIRLWLGTLLTAIMRRKVVPAQRTLLVADEAAQLGEFEPLLTACTLLRGYGLQLITAWQDVAQIKSRYKLDWPTIINNAAALLTFGQGHYAAAKEYAEVMGIEASELLKMSGDQAALSVRGEGTRKIRRMNYLTDPMFEGMADPNPYFARRKGKGR